MRPMFPQVLSSITRHRGLPLAVLACLLPVHAHAVEPACNRYIDAAEKSASQPARQTVTESGGTRMEAIAIGGKAWSRIDAGAWTPLPPRMRAVELRMVGDLRSGRLPIGACKVVGADTLDGKPMTVVAYTLTVGGSATPTRAWIGRDGLVHALSADGVKSRFRYTGVSAPAP